MAAKKRLVLFVEGPGDRLAVPVLLKRLVTHHGGWDVVVLDDKPFEVGDVSNVIEANRANWIRWLEAVKKRPQLGAVLLLLDGDLKPRKGRQFSADDTARLLADQARAAGAGVQFSVAVGFACQEFESWLIAGVESLAGKPIPGQPDHGVRAGTTAPPGDLETNPRDAKGWLGGCMLRGYKLTRHQAPLTNMVDLEMIRRRNLRWFQHLETSLMQLIEAFRTGMHIVTPTPPG